MKKGRLIVTSTRPDAGKTSAILGLCKNMGISCGYIKPLGDRLLYKKKRLWDHDASLMTKVFKLVSEPEDMTLGFELAKLEYMYDKDSIKEKLNEVVDRVSNDYDFIFIESGEDIASGSFVNLSAIEMAKYLDAQILVVATGGENRVLDDLTALARNVDSNLIKGVIVNRQNGVSEFKDNYLEKIEELGFKVFGVLPELELLSRISVEQISDELMAKIIVGGDHLNRAVDHIDVGAMSVSEASKKDIFNKKNNLIITSGDRADIVMTALESSPSAIVLTNGILPPKNIISSAEQKRVPLLLVSMNTFEATKKIDDINTLIFADDSEKIECLKEIFEKSINVTAIME